MFDRVWLEKALELQKAMKEMTEHSWKYDKSWLDKAMEMQKMINIPGIDPNWYKEMLGGIMKGHPGSGIFNFQDSDESGTGGSEDEAAPAGGGAGSAPAGSPQGANPPGAAPSGVSEAGPPGAWQPQFTIMEATGHITLTAYIPGIKSKDDISIRLRGDTLYVSGKNQSASGWQGQDGRTLEFFRAIRLPGSVRNDGTSAHYGNGSLTVKIPKNRPVSVDLDFTQ
jgi:HSP20 family molecular chaperone IbpA